MSAALVSGAASRAGVAPVPFQSGIWEACKSLWPDSDLQPRIEADLVVVHHLPDTIHLVGREQS